MYIKLNMIIQLAITLWPKRNKITAVRETYNDSWFYTRNIDYHKNCVENLDFHKNILLATFTPIGAYAILKTTDG